MSGNEEEYEVEQIQRAKVVKKGAKRIWHYHVKWKGYDLDANTWEPKESFEGSEHFIEEFWARISDPRSHEQIELFKLGEEIFPVGPPRKLLKKKSEREPRTSPRRPTKLKETDSENEVQSLVEPDNDEVEVVTRPAPSGSRKRRTSAVEQASEPPSPKRRRSRNAVAVESDSDIEIVVPPMKTRTQSPSKRISKPSPKAKAAEASGSTARATRSSASARKAPAGRETTISSWRKQPVASSPEVISVDSDSEPNQQENSGPATPVARKPISTTEPNGSAKLLPAHRARAAKPLVKLADDAVAVESGSTLAVKSRLTRKFAAAEDNISVAASSEKNGTPSTSRGPKVPGTRAGPGRSSRGMVTRSNSLLTVVKGGVRTIQRGPENVTRPERLRQSSVARSSRAVSVDAMAVDEPLEAPLLAPLSTEDLDRLAVLTQPGAPAQPVADDLPDYEDVTDRDAEGEVDHEPVQHPETVEVEAPVAAQARTEEPAKEASSPADEQAIHVEETSKEPEAPAPPKEPVINPPNTAIGNGDSTRRHSFAAWRTATIFDNLSAPSFRRTSEPETTSPEHSTPVFTIPINASKQITIALKDIHPATEPSRQRLDEIAVTGNCGPPGKLYKGEHASNMIKAFSVGGSCARVILEKDDDEEQKIIFDRFRNRLKDNGLFVAMVGSHVLAFCSSENNELAAKLHASPNLIGLGDNILVSEVIISDDSAYIDAAMNAEDERW